MLDEGPTDGIYDSSDPTEEEININVSKANKNFYLILHYSGDESYL